MMTTCTSSFRSNNKLPLQRATRSSMVSRVITPVDPLTKKINQSRDRKSQEDVVEEILENMAQNGGKNTHGFVQQVIDRYRARGFDCIDRHIIRYRLKLRLKGKKMLPNGNHVPVKVSPTAPEIAPTLALTPAPKPAPTEAVQFSPTNTDLSPLTCATSVTSTTESEASNTDEAEAVATKVRKNIGGRKKGSTKKSALFKIKSYQLALTTAANRLIEAKIAAKAADKLKVADGTIHTIVADVEKEFALEKGSINWKTVTSRVQANNPEGICHQKVSPLLDVENLIVEWAIRLSRMNEPLNKSSIMDLMDDLIRDTVHQERLLAFCGKRGIEKDGERLVGNGWYEGMMKRNSNRLTRKRVQIRDQNRRTWCTVEHFTNMYDSVYTAMVKCGVAELLENEIMYDKDGNETLDRSEMVGRPSKYRLLKPERCLFVDETGCNTNQKEDGFAGGERFIVATDQQENGRTGSVTDMHFTVLPFISGTGEAVMCAIVLKSEKEAKDIPIRWRMGVDIRKDIKDGETRVDFFLANSEPDGMMCGGPKCRYNGIDIPCFICTSPKSSITTDLLCEMLKFIDKLGVFPRSSPNDTPFLLLDGHQSRTKLQFLEYITDPIHRWCVCIGVPYGTHIWQPADSSELNGSFKISFQKAKMAYVKHKPQDERSFKVTDIVPIVNMAWNESLGRKERARKAIINRGWGVLNYVLLDDDRLLPSSEDIAEDQSSTSTTTNPEELEIITPVNDNEQEGDWTKLRNLLKTVNRTGSTYSACLEALVNEEKKSEGRQKAFLESKAKGDLRKRKIEALELMGNITSSKLAVANYYWMDDELRDRFREIEKQKTEVEEKMKGRKDYLKEKQDEAFRVAGNKFKTRSSQLTVPDMIVLLRKVPPLTPDSPIKTKKSELQQQFHRRENRLRCYLDPLHEMRNETQFEESNESAGLEFLSGVVHNLFSENDPTGIVPTSNSNNTSSSTVTGISEVRTPLDYEGVASFGV